MRDTLSEQSSGESANFVQPFDHIDLQLDVFQTQLAVARFIDWDLETEHGDLGLGSRSSSSSSPANRPVSPTPDKSPTPDTPQDSRLVLPLPPRSAFGRRLADPRNREALASLREQTLAQARGNVGLARLRLENVHASQSLSAAQADALPANVVAFFDAGVRRIEEQPPALRDLGLKVIAAVAHYDFGEGVEYAVLDRILRDTAKAAARRQQPSRTQSAPVVGASSSSSSNYSSASGSKTTMASAAVHVPHRSLEEMLHAARGFVVVGGLGHRPLEAYCESFHAYARENYSEALVWAHAQLDFGGDGPAGGLVGIGSSKGAMRRSRTGVAHFVEKRDQAATQRPFPFGRLQERQFGGGGVGGGVGDDWAAGRTGRGGGGRAAGRSAAPDGATAGAGEDAAEADADADADAADAAADANTNMDCSGARGEMPKEQQQDAVLGAAVGAKKTAPSTGAGRDPSFRMVKRPTWA